MSTLNDEIDAVTIDIIKQMMIDIELKGPGKTELLLAFDMCGSGLEGDGNAIQSGGAINVSRYAMYVTLVAIVTGILVKVSLGAFMQDFDGRNTDVFDGLSTDAHWSVVVKALEKLMSAVAGEFLTIGAAATATWTFKSVQPLIRKCMGIASTKLGPELRLIAKVVSSKDYDEAEKKLLISNIVNGMMERVDPLELSTDRVELPLTPVMGQSGPSTAKLSQKVQKAQVEVAADMSITVQKSVDDAQSMKAKKQNKKKKSK